jgi:hypothetical protein
MTAFNRAGWRQARVACAQEGHVGRDQDVTTSATVGHDCAGLASMIDGGERYCDPFFTSLSIWRQVRNST